MTGYTRQSDAAIDPGQPIDAAPLDAEFNAIQTAFDATLGHTHDGSTGSGPKLNLTNSTSGTLPLARGGTGGTDAATARTSLGLGTIATQASSSVTITGGSITGITDLAVADGGTGASDAATARTNLGVGSLGTQSSNSVTITGGSITGITDLAVADGGTGASTLAANGVLVGNGTSAVQVTGTGTIGQVLTSNGPSSAPTFQDTTGVSFSTVRPYEVKTGNFNAVAFYRYRSETNSGSITATLPASPSDGTIITFRRKGTNTLVIDRNTKTIAGSSTNLTINYDKAEVDLKYNSTTSDWEVEARIYS